MVDEDYLKVLYKDFDTKINSINRYTQNITQHTARIDKQVHDLVNKFREKSKLLIQEPTEQQAPSDYFAIESKIDPTQPSDTHVTLNDIKALDSALNSLSKTLNYSFDKALRDLQFLAQSYNEAAEQVNNIHKTWSELLENKD